MIELHQKILSQSFVELSLVMNLRKVLFEIEKHFWVFLFYLSVRNLTPVVSNTKRGGQTDKNLSPINLNQNKNTIKCVTFA